MSDRDYQRLSNQIKALRFSQLQTLSAVLLLVHDQEPSERTRAIAKLLEREIATLETLKP